ncbi:HlyD family secretion protein [Mesorhizobium sp.]|uniref:HlyD family secretion protein n=1 Tax=Mesorhizobium sp. TaxID=1871066 RepID=UPI00257EFD57|nr:HlyD family efflux transporter periplasmic adaptor subunit [Mesorhizobium sp.]
MKPERALFRPEAVEHQRSQRQWGRVALLQPPSIKIMAWGGVAIVGAIFIFLILAPYARKETVIGYLTPTEGMARVFAAQPGVIRAVHVSEGDVVEQGKPLLTIDTGQISGSGEDVNAAVLRAMQSQRGLIQDQISGEERRARTESDRLRAVIRGQEAEISFLKDQVDIHEQRIRLAETMIQPAADLSAKGLMPRDEHVRRQEALLEQRQSLNALRQQISVRQSQITETRYTLDQVPISATERTQELRRNLEALEQQIAEVEGRRSYVVRAPRSGRVSALYATEGQVADPRLLQMVIAPPTAVLEAELFVPTRAIGFVRIGQPVRILYEAFPYQSFGTYKARTVRVAHTVLTKADVAVPLPIEEPVYRVTAALDRPDIDAYGQKVPLQPGMVLKADIILEERSLMTWLIDPLLSARR